MKKIAAVLFILSIAISSCKKENNITTEKWEFTRLINANLDDNGNLESLDFYQKKGNQWRILQFEPDDYVTLYLKDTITPSSYELPVENADAFITSNVRLFNPATNQVHFPDRLRWFARDPVEFNNAFYFADGFPDLPDTWNTLSKISAASYSYENAYDNNGKTDTYIFYDFPNQKYVYYGIKSGADVIIENTLPLLCTTCNTINWKNMDAVANTGSISNNEDNYYFFDFNVQKMYVLSRINKNTNHPSFAFDSGLTIDFKNAFFDKYGSNGGNELPFDFSK